MMHPSYRRYLVRLWTECKIQSEREALALALWML